ATLSGFQVDFLGPLTPEGKTFLQCHHEPICSVNRMNACARGHFTLTDFLTVIATPPRSGKLVTHWLHIVKTFVSPGGCHARWLNRFKEKRQARPPKHFPRVVRGTADRERVRHASRVFLTGENLRPADSSAVCGT